MDVRKLLGTGSIPERVQERTCERCKCSFGGYHSDRICSECKAMMFEGMAAKLDATYDPKSPQTWQRCALVLAKLYGEGWDKTGAYEGTFRKSC